jgi:WD40 repeat protein
LASVGDDHHVRLWDVATGKLAADLGEHDCQTTAVGFSPDGSRLASCDDRGLIRIWDVATRTEEKVLKGHDGKIDGALFADRGRLVTMSADYYVIGWDVEVGIPRWKAWTPNEALLSMAVSPSGTTIATGNHLGGVGMWNAGDGRRLGMFGTRTTLIQTVAFSSNGELIAAGGHDGIAQVWDVASQTYCGQTLPHRERLWSVAFSPDGRMLATASRDRSVKLWDVAAHRQPRREKLDAESFGIAFSDGEQMLGFFEDGGLRLWPRDSADSRPKAGEDPRRGYRNTVAWAAGKWFLCRRDGDRRAIESTDDEVCLVRPDAGAIDHLKLSRDGQWLSLRALAGIEIWHVPSQRLRRQPAGN